MPVRRCCQALGCHDCRLADRFGSNAHFRQQEGLQQLVQTLLAQSNDSDTLELQHRLLCMLWYLARKPMESKWSSGAAAAALISSQGEPGVSDRRGRWQQGRLQFKGDGLRQGNWVSNPSSSFV